MSAEIVRFVFNHDDEETPIRATVREGDPWFVGADVCRGLGVANGPDAMRRLKAKQKGIVLIDTPGGPQRMIVISESGLFLLAMRSDKERARHFQDWLAEEVLPTLRRTGKYELTQKIESAPCQSQLLEAINALNDRLGGIEVKLGDGRKNFSAQALRYAFEGVAKHNNGECPYCDTVIVTKDGKPLDNACAHHGNFNRRDTRPQNCMPSCRDDHERIHNPHRPDHIPEHEAVSVAISFHRTLRRKAALIRPPKPLQNPWDFRAFIQADMGFPQLIKKRVKP